MKVICKRNRFMLTLKLLQSNSGIFTHSKLNVTPLTFYKLIDSYCFSLRNCLNELNKKSMQNQFSKH
ncbi:hypothetical protein T07_3088 [Trichinella nelsoni]|uniref:Uncharacterized protein n=1 Tax=Trichinella nelsoni TaxID=6336 RepID=A0A0V0SHF8_9BILA|nr:hypothetical protein T07_3088 [Trichinella nelsoni]